MSAAIIDGQPIADRMRAAVAEEARQFTARYGHPPGLGVVLVGDNPASAQYVRMKRKACETAGIASYAHLLPADATQEAVEAAVSALNDDPRVHGILVQLPLPGQIDEQRILQLVSLDKDVDGFHPINIGLLGMKGREPLFTPATPTGCMVLLKEIGVPLEGANAVVVGRSNIVGLPVALMLMKANATVTVCHSRTRNLPEVTREAEILCVGAGRPGLITADMVRPGAVVLDFGTNWTERGLVGDVDFEAVKEVAGAITPVPGGIGPVTTAVLLRNTLEAARQH